MSVCACVCNIKHGTHMKGVMSHIWKSHITHVQKLCNTWLRLVGSLKWLVSFAKEPYQRDDILWRMHISRVNEDYYTCEWRLLHMWMKITTHVKGITPRIWRESCHTCGKVISHICRSHAIYMKESCYTYECVAWLLHTCGMTSVQGGEDSRIP